MIGKIERVKLREVWKHEAYDFTRWLEENIDVLNDVLDISIVNVEREKKAGTFSVDLVGEDDSGNVVVIENQLEKSDHDHLGKLITYLVAMDAKVAIWIVSNPRPEHINAISWLNEPDLASFYLLKVEAIKIGESPPAPLLTNIVGPTNEIRDVGQTKKEFAERYHIRYRFWEQLLEYSKKKTKLFDGISASRYYWIGKGSGIRGITFDYRVRKHDSEVGLYIDRDHDTGEGNKEIFDRLLLEKSTIEEVFGGPLLWLRQDQHRASGIAVVIENGGYKDEEKWPEVQEVMVATMIRFEKALRPHLKSLKL